MILSGTELKKLLNNRQGDFRERLIITPILDLESQMNDGSGSIDLRLGSFFSIPIRSEIPSLTLDKEQYKKIRDKSMRSIYIELGKEFILHPRQFILGHTIEWIHLPYNLAAYVVGRSTWGRHGLIIATAVGVHPRYSGILTLELTNLGEVPIPLKPGLRYAQLFLHTVQCDLESKVDQSSFMGSTKPSIGDIDSKEIDLINKIRSK